LNNIKPVVENSGFLDYSYITSGPASKKNQLKKERNYEIESNNMLLLDRIYSILSEHPKPLKKRERRSLNYGNRKKENGRIYEENQGICRRLKGVEPSVDLGKIRKWSKDVQGYKRNISASGRRVNPYKPILTQGIVNVYPELRPKTCTGSVRGRNFSSGIPSIDHFTNLLNSESFVNNKVF